MDILANDFVVNLKQQNSKSWPINPAQVVLSSNTTAKSSMSFHHFVGPTDHIWDTYMSYTAATRTMNTSINRKTSFGLLEATLEPMYNFHEFFTLILKKLKTEGETSVLSMGMEAGRKSSVCADRN